MQGGLHRAREYEALYPPLAGRFLLWETECLPRNPVSLGLDADLACVAPGEVTGGE